jgi:hypothetical protein
MNETMTAQRTPEIIAAEIRALSGQVLGSIIEIGRRFTEAKELIPYGSFGAWVDGTGYSLSTANNFMRIFREYGGQTSLFGSEAESQTLGKLSYTKALALLAVPAEEREQVAEELDAEHLSARELEKALKERDEWQKATAKAREEAMAEHERAKELEYDLEKARRAVEDAGPYKEKLAEAEKRVKELESRPVEVAVERDEEAIKKAAEDARKAAEDAAKKEMDKLREKLEKAEKAREKAEKDAEDAKKRAVEDAGPYEANGRSPVGAIHESPADPRVCTTNGRGQAPPLRSGQTSGRLIAAPTQQTDRRAGTSPAPTERTFSAPYSNPSPQATPQFFIFHFSFFIYPLRDSCNSCDNCDGFFTRHRLSQAVTSPKPALLYSREGFFQKEYAR